VRVGDLVVRTIGGCGPGCPEKERGKLTQLRWVRLRVSSAALRTIDRNGIDAVLAELRARGEI